MSHGPTSTPTQCLWCGNNPTSHASSRLDTFLFLLLDRPMRWFLLSDLGRLMVLGIDALWWVMYALLKPFGAMRFVPFIPSDDVTRATVVARAATARGFTIENLQVLGKATETFRLTKGSQSLIYSGVPRPNRTNQVSSGWLDDKWLLKQCLMKAQVPVSRGQVVYSFARAKQVFATLNKPVIVKPRFGSRGRHTTTHITTLDQLVVAYRRARQLCWPVLIEEHLYGSVYRATCIDGQVVGILSGEPPRITGDGVRTIVELIDYKNATRDPQQGPVRLTAKLDEFLATLTYSLTTVLPAGKTIDLTEKIGLSYGGTSHELYDVTHPRLLEQLARAALATKDPIVGFDFISTDITADPDTVRWGIIECNSVPFINLHHDPMYGAPRDAAGALMDYVERTLYTRG